MNSYKRSKRMSLDIIIGFITLVFCIVVIIGEVVVVPIIKNSNERTIVATVTDKEVKDDIYLVYTNETTFEIEDSIIKGKFHSSDVYGSIEIGKTYEFTVCGVRNGFLSMYPNILDFKECK